MTLTIKPVTSSLLGDVAQLFSTEKVADDCWCMSFIIPVKEFHATGHTGNRASFCELVANSRALLEAAVQLARENGAAAIDGFPRTNTKKHASGDPQVGSESLFSACGFDVIRTPSTSRVVMRRT